MAVTLTEKAAAEFKRAVETGKFEPSTMLRVGVSGGGCSGFQYSLNFEQKANEETDSTYEYHGVKLIVDKKSALYLDGTTVDFYEGLDRRGFVFTNPNATKTCGCGSSFQA